jgi:hypothetical protein
MGDDVRSGGEGGGDETRREDGRQNILAVEPAMVRR